MTFSAGAIIGELRLDTGGFTQGVAAAVQAASAGGAKIDGALSATLRGVGGNFAGAGGSAGRFGAAVGALAGGPLAAGYDALRRFATGGNDVGSALLRTQGVLHVFGPTVGTFLTSPLLGAAAAAKSLVSSIGGFVGSGLRLAAEYEQLEITYGVLLGSGEAAKRVLGDLEKFAAVTPFETGPVRRAAKVLLGYNFAAEEVVGELRRIGDVAAGLGVPLVDLATLYGKARIEGRVMARELSEFANHGVPLIAEFARQFGVAESEVRKLVESGAIGFPELQAAFAAMSGEGGRFFNLMDRQSASTLGLLSTLRSDIDKLKLGIGVAVLAAFDAGEGVNSLIAGVQLATPVLVRLATDGAGAVADRMGSLPEILASVEGGVRRLGSALVEGITAAAAFASAHGETILVAGQVAVALAGVTVAINLLKGPLGLLVGGVQAGTAAWRAYAAAVAMANAATGGLTLGGAIGGMAKLSAKTTKAAKGLALVDIASVVVQVKVVAALKAGGVWLAKLAGGALLVGAKLAVPVAAVGTLGIAVYRMIRYGEAFGEAWSEAALRVARGFDYLADKSIGMVLRQLGIMEGKLRILGSLGDDAQQAQERIGQVGQRRSQAFAAAGLGEERRAADGRLAYDTGSGRLDERKIERALSLLKEEAAAIERLSQVDHEFARANAETLRRTNDQRIDALERLLAATRESAAARQSAEVSASASAAAAAEVSADLQIAAAASVADAVEAQADPVAALRAEYARLGRVFRERHRVLVDTDAAAEAFAGLAANFARQIAAVGNKSLDELAGGEATRETLDEVRGVVVARTRHAEAVAEAWREQSSAIAADVRLPAADDADARRTASARADLDAMAESFARLRRVSEQRVAFAVETGAAISEIDDLRADYERQRQAMVDRHLVLAVEARLDEESLARVRRDLAALSRDAIDVEGPQIDVEGIGRVVDAQRAKFADLRADFERQYKFAVDAGDSEEDLARLAQRYQAELRKIAGEGNRLGVEAELDPASLAELRRRLREMYGDLARAPLDAPVVPPPEIPDASPAFAAAGVRDAEAYADGFASVEGPPSSVRLRPPFPLPPQRRLPGPFRPPPRATTSLAGRPVPSGWLRRCRRWAGCWRASAVRWRAWRPSATRSPARRPVRRQCSTSPAASGVRRPTCSPNSARLTPCVPAGRVPSRRDSSRRWTSAA